MAHKSILGGKYKMKNFKGFNNVKSFRVFGRDFNVETLTEAEAEFLVLKEFKGIVKMDDKSSNKID